MRDGAGEASAIVSPDGLETSLLLDPSGRLAEIANPANEVHAFEYTDDGLLLSMVTPRGNLHAFDYDALGLLTRDESPTTVQTLVRSDAGPGFEVVHTSGNGVQSRYRLGRSRFGEMGEFIGRADGSNVRLNVDPAGSSQQAFAVGTTRAVTLSTDPFLGMQSPQSTLVETLPSGLAREVSRSREVGEVGALGVPDSFTSRVEVNGAESVSTWDRATGLQTFTSPEGRTTTTQLDALGQVVSTQMGTLAPVVVQYDTRGRVLGTTQTDGTNTRTMAMTYDSQGFVESVTDGLGRVTTYEYDEVGRVARQVLPDLREVTFSYDADGNVETITPPSRPAHGFEYDAESRATSYDPPVLPDVPIPSTQYTYNDDHQVELIVRPDGAQIDFVYDPVTGKVAEVLTPEGAYGSAYDPQGRLIARTDPFGGALSYVYDGDLLLAEALLGEVSGTVSRTYDADFIVATESVNGVETVAMTYDDDGLLTQVGAETLSYDPETGLPTGTTLGAMTSTMTYNALGEVASMSYALSGTEVYAASYARDGLGRIRAKLETVNGVARTQCYDYDEVGRLVEVHDGFDQAANDCVGTLAEEYRYDGNSNRIFAANSAGVVDETQVVVDEQDRLIEYGSLRFEYTANGELREQEDVATGEITTFDYDVMGNLRRVGLPNGDVVEYVTDARDRRVGRRVNGVLVQGFVYGDQLNPVAELDGSGNIVARFVYGSRGHVPDYMVRDGQTYRLVSDHLGSVVAVVDVSSGLVVQEVRYDSWGRVLADTNPGFLPFGFAGGSPDGDTGLLRFGVRDYDAHLGRWSVKDYAGFFGATVALFEYTSNDPVNWIDPTGYKLRPSSRSGNQRTSRRERRMLREAIRQCHRSAVCRATLARFDEAFDVDIPLFLDPRDSRSWFDDGKGAPSPIQICPTDPEFLSSPNGPFPAPLSFHLNHEMGHMLEHPNSPEDLIKEQYDDPYVEDWIERM